MVRNRPEGHGPPEGFVGVMIGLVYDVDQRGPLVRSDRAGSMAGGAGATERCLAAGKVCRNGAGIKSEGRLGSFFGARRYQENRRGSTDSHLHATPGVRIWFRASSIMLRTLSLS